MLVCTLPSPACMCSATKTRPRSTSAWIASHLLIDRLETPRRRRSAAAASRSSVFHETMALDCASRTAGARSKSSRVQVRPAIATAERPAHAAHQLERCALRPVAAATVLESCDRQLAGEELLQRVQQLQLVGDRELDVDALDAVGVLAQLLERDHHVLVDLEGVGVLGDRRGARAVEPEALARLGRHRDEALAVARVGDAHHCEAAAATASSSSPTMSPISTMRGRAAARLGGVAHRLHVALVQVLEAGEDDAFGCSST